MRQDFIWGKIRRCHLNIWFLPQSEAMYAFKANGKKLAIAELTPQQEKMRLLFGVRHCDIRGIACLDEVFLDERHVDPQYLEKRKNTVIIALACNEAKPSCFCESMDINRTEADKDVAMCKFTSLPIVMHSWL